MQGAKGSGGRQVVVRDDRLGHCRYPARMRSDRPSPLRILALAAACAAALGLGALWRGHVLRAQATAALPVKAPTSLGMAAAQPRRHTLQTTHFLIDSTAGDSDTAEVGAAAEALHSAWHAFFADALRGRPAHTGPLRIRLYAGQAEFKAHNRSRHWAEAYYLHPLSHAYIPRGRRNRHHWMLHEVVHQLNTEVLGRRHPRWIEEGFACYFGASRLRGGMLQPGDVDPDTYPAWWLGDFALSDDPARDVQRRRMIPLRAMLTGKDVPPLSEHVNLHYVQHWTLVHFLMHGDGGRHAAGFRKLMRTDAGLKEFERLIGPVDRIEAAWRTHRGLVLAGMREDATSHDAGHGAAPAPLGSTR